MRVGFGQLLSTQFDTGVAAGGDVRQAARASGFLARHIAALLPDYPG
ncbi:hypothetical protein ECKG_05105 [Escherichia coli TA206]|nr:hypothetical protein ECKG_05105 [Escherichia coli TA206]